LPHFEKLRPVKKDAPAMLPRRRFRVSFFSRCSPLAHSINWSAASLKGLLFNCSDRPFVGRELRKHDPDVSLEMRKATLHGIPGILIHDRLVLEVKVASKKTERDRLVGQCCEYSRGYVTWAIVMDEDEDEFDEEDEE
jgi:hypothetical protein